MTVLPFARTAGPDTTRNYIGHLFTFLADGAMTGGAFSVLDATVRKGLEPPAHTHTHEDETYLILGGLWRFKVGDQDFEAGPGSLVFLPRGVQHVFSIDDDAARALVLMNPAGLETAFWEMSQPTDRTSGLPDPPSGPPPIAHMLDVFGARGVRFAPPPR
jgi:quercetin dioxygenase-like cupin family protein